MRTAILIALAFLWSMPLLAQDTDSKLESELVTLHTQWFKAYDSGDEAENFQAVGVRLRECLVSFIGETISDEMVPEGQEPPKQADFKGWTELLANTLAGGDANAHLRSYLKKVSVETWAYVNWLTHAKNAIRMDAEIGLKTVEHLLGVFTAARQRLGQNRLRCAACGSYQVVGGTCESCGLVRRLPANSSPR